ncbi:MAG: hypothetical protein SFX18_19915, partial [Pirellulales bacterium]|nr:hypothetical protein [Pirellulales bacterium]
MNITVTAGKLNRIGKRRLEIFENRQSVFVDTIDLDNARERMRFVEQACLASLVIDARCKDTDGLDLDGRWLIDLARQAASKADAPKSRLPDIDDPNFVFNPHARDDDPPQQQPTTTQAVLRCMADIQPEEITWLWPQRIA